MRRSSNVQGKMILKNNFEEEDSQKLCYTLIKVVDPLGIVKK